MAQTLKRFLKTIPPKGGAGHDLEAISEAIVDLFKLRLANGDNFLHMTLNKKQPLLKYLIYSIHTSGMDHLLNMRNGRLQTILHLAIVNCMPEMIPFLISKGCDPMLEDIDGNNVIHYTLMYSSTCLDPLLKAVKFKMPYDLDAYNFEKQTPLHLAVLYNAADSAHRLLKEGASYKVLDNEGRSPLHLAAYDDCLSVARAILAFVKPEDVDFPARGYSALQIVCNSFLRENTVEMAKLLLEHKADPMKAGRYKSPWCLSKTKPELRTVLEDYVQQPPQQDEDITSDEFESADEASVSECSDDELAATTAQKFSNMTLQDKDNAEV